MKYYAVTEDPNELLHYGRLGMKWGQHIFVGPKSLAYRKAEGKLRSSSSKTKGTSKVKATINKAKNAVKKTMVQHNINKQKKQQAKYNEAVKKAQQRLSITEKMHNLDNLTSYEKSVDRAYKRDAFASKVAKKQERFNDRMDRKYIKNERKMDKYTQEAREGRLRYGKLSEDQVNRITERLATERAARQLGSTEKAKFRTRMKEAVQEGMLEGVKRGTAAGITEVAVAKVQNRLKNKRTLDKNSENEAERQKKATRIKNSRTRKEIREDLKQEAYEAQVESGAGIFERNRVLHPFTNLNAGKMKLQAEQRKKLNSQVAEYKLLYDVDRHGNAKGETKLNREVKALEDKKQMHEAENALKKRLYERDAYENLDPVKRANLESFEDAKLERKRQQDMRNKIRNEEDEAWNKHVKEGRSTLLYDVDTNSLINLDDARTTLATSNPEKFREARAKVVAQSQKQWEAAEREAYNNYVKEKQAEDLKEAKQQAREQATIDYQRDLKQWRDDLASDNQTRKQYKQDMDNWNTARLTNPNAVKPTRPHYRNTPKPKSYDDYFNDVLNNLYKPKQYLDYEDYKKQKNLGLPSQFDGNKGNKNGGRKNK